MKILITGANGFLGYYLTNLLLQKGHAVIATGKGPARLLVIQKHFSYFPMDFTAPYAVASIVRETKPAVIIHAGAISKPDECELNPELAYKTNVTGTYNLLQVAAELGCYFLFVSTDFIFDGNKGMYTEDDIPNPVNYYGQTKAEAEKLVKEYSNDWSIVRTVLLYGNPNTGRSNILTIVKEKLEKGEQYKVVNDQVRTPTYVEDLAVGISSIIEKKVKGIYHLSGEDILTPYEMAKMAASYLGLDISLLKKVSEVDFSQPARRPLKTGFIIDKAKKEIGFRPVGFSEGLKKTFFGF